MVRRFLRGIEFCLNFRIVPFADQRGEIRVQHDGAPRGGEFNPAGADRLIKIIPCEEVPKTDQSGLSGDRLVNQVKP